VILSSTHYKRHAKRIHQNKNDSHLPFIPMPWSNNKKSNASFKSVNYWVDIDDVDDDDGGDGGGGVVDRGK
jgi:hypothetical protein